MFRILFALCAVSLIGALADGVPKLDGRIVGGENADIRQYPHQVSMRLNGRHRCGGSIIASNIIVSAVHCVVGLDSVAGLTIVVGSTRLSEAKHQELAVTQFIMHESYKAGNNDNDVAILLVNGDFTFSDLVQPIELATERPEAGTPVTVTGWGTLVSGGTVSEHLQQVDVNVLSNADCKKSYPFLITNRMLCAGVTGGGKDACQGDSGGPMVYNNQLLGIVSWGFGCASAAFPGVYAAVPELRDWILDVVHANVKYGSIDFL